MEDTYNNRTSLAKGAKDMVKEAKRHAAKKVNKVVDRAADEYSGHRNYSRFQDEEDEDEDFYRNPPRQDGERYHDNDEGSSDATEGHDDEDVCILIRQIPPNMCVHFLETGLRLSQK